MTKVGIEIMVLDDEPIVGERLKDFLEGKGLSVESYTDSKKAIQRISEKDFDVLVTDYKMDGPNGLDVLRFVNECSPSTQVIVITAYTIMERIRESEALGAFDFVAKPFALSEIHRLVCKAARTKRKRG